MSERIRPLSDKGIDFIIILGSNAIEKYTYDLNLINDLIRLNHLDEESEQIINFLTKIGVIKKYEKN